MHTNYIEEIDFIHHALKHVNETLTTSKAKDDELMVMNVRKLRKYYTVTHGGHFLGLFVCLFVFSILFETTAWFIFDSV